MADELYLLKVHGNHAGQHSEMGIYFHGSNLTLGEIVDNAIDLLDGFETNVLGPLLDILPASYEVERMSARRITPAGGVEMVKQYQDGDGPGTVAGGAASNQLCPVVRLIPPMGTKSAGRFFLPAIAESDIAANIPVAGWTTRLATLMAAMLTNIGMGSIVWLVAVYSTKLGTYVDAVTYDTSPTVGFQSRRNRPH
jgi:hypothetical protein